MHVLLLLDPLAPGTAPGMVPKQASEACALCSARLLQSSQSGVKPSIDFQQCLLAKNHTTLPAPDSKIDPWRARQFNMQGALKASSASWLPMDNVCSVMQ